MASNSCTNLAFKSYHMEFSAGGISGANRCLRRCAYRRFQKQCFQRWREACYRLQRPGIIPGQPVFVYNWYWSLRDKEDTSKPAQHVKARQKSTMATSDVHCVAHRPPIAAMATIPKAALTYNTVAKILPSWLSSPICSFVFSCSFMLHTHFSRRIGT